MSHTYADEKHLISRELFKEKMDQVIANLGPGSAGTTVVANPTLAGTESALEGLQVGNTKYKIDQPVIVVECVVTQDPDLPLLHIESKNTIPKSIVFSENTILVFSFTIDTLTPTLPVSTFNAYTIFKSETRQILQAVCISIDGSSVGLLPFGLSYENDEVSFDSSIQLS